MKNNKNEPKYGSHKTRGQALRATQRTVDDAKKTLERFSSISVNKQDDHYEKGKLKITFLGGLYDVGEKNMSVIEYGDCAIVLDCGIDLSVELPSINYVINDFSYLETIKHKIKGYVITHGHLDHIGGLKHTVPKYPAPIYGSRYTIGVIQKTFDDEQHISGGYSPELVIADMENHDKLKVGEFFVEFIRVTHAIPDPSAVCIDTPVGRIIATGDFRLDPEPLDKRPVDKERFKQLGRDGVLLLMSDSSYADEEGRTPTEHTLEPSYSELITRAKERIFVAVFSSNINRTQMIINAAVASGRRVAFDGRSMLSYAEIALRQGILKIPKGAIVPMAQVNNLPVSKVLIMCTGGQGEPNAALQRMSEGTHKYIKLTSGDTVLISSSPIPGNEISYDEISNRLSAAGVNLFRHVTHKLDGCGPLHVSGHAKRDELREMITMVQPKYFIPVHGGALRRKYHADLAVKTGVVKNNIALPKNGEAIYFEQNTMSKSYPVRSGSLLIDQSGSIVETPIVQDRLVLSESGFLSIGLTIDNQSQKSVTNPSIDSRGYVSITTNNKLVADLQKGLVRAVDQRFGRVDGDRFQDEIKDYVSQFLFERTNQTPTIILDVHVVSKPKPNRDSKDTAVDNQQRFKELRKQLLTAAS
jgi:ribonuclease J